MLSNESRAELLRTVSIEELQAALQNRCKRRHVATGGYVVEVAASSEMQRYLYRIRFGTHPTGSKEGAERDPEGVEFTGSVLLSRHEVSELANMLQSMMDDS